jgi:hypothetical protein
MSNFNILRSSQPMLFIFQLLALLPRSLLLLPPECDRALLYQLQHTPWQAQRLEEGETMNKTIPTNYKLLSNNNSH